MVSLDGSDAELIARIGRDTALRSGDRVDLALDTAAIHLSILQRRGRSPDMESTNITGVGGIVDCHAHIIDPERFPFTGTRVTTRARTREERAKRTLRGPRRTWREQWRAGAAEWIRHRQLGQSGRP